MVGGINIIAILFYSLGTNTIVCAKNKTSYIKDI